MSALAIGILWLLHFLPLSVVAAIGNGIGAIAFWLIPERRHVVRVNLRKCFPHLEEREREQLAREHFKMFCRSFVERGILWWAPRARLERLIRVEGLEHLHPLAGRPAIILAPHFVGFEAAIMRLTMEFPVSGMYATQKDALADRVALRGRSRFGGQLMPRQSGIWGALQVLRAGGFYFYLPDMDYGRKHSIFVPFFGVPTATVPALSQMVRRSGAAVVPCTTRMLPGGEGYIVRLEAPWQDFPTGDAVADTRRMLAYIEERARDMPEQYYWLHKRFKTRPEGEPGFY
jgi:KDO2-lipid IV(A) lauroyltransferase